MVAKVGRRQQEGLVVILSPRGRAEVEVLPPMATGPRLTGRGAGGASDPSAGVRRFLTWSEALHGIQTHP